MKTAWRWIGDLVSRIPLFVRLVFALLFVSLLYATMPRPNVLVSASLDSESADIRVLNADEMTLRLPKAVVDDGTPTCRDQVVVRVEPGGKLALSRSETGDLHIASEGMTQWTSADGSMGSAVDGVYLTVSSKEPCATDQQILRLPAVGELSVGMIASASSNIEEFLPLRAGELTVYGRAITPPFYLTWLSWMLPIEPEKLYVAGSFPVPAGSQIEGRDARFWGFITVDLKDGHGMRIEASTNAREVNLFAPAPKVSDAVSSDRATSLEADRISMTLGAQLLGDPNLHLIFGAIAAMFAIVGFLVNLEKFVRRSQPTPDKAFVSPDTPRAALDVARSANTSTASVSAGTVKDEQAPPPNAKSEAALTPPPNTGSSRDAQANTSATPRKAPEGEPNQ